MRTFNSCWSLSRNVLVVSALGVAAACAAQNAGPGPDANMSAGGSGPGGSSTGSSTSSAGGVPDPWACPPCNGQPCDSIKLATLSGAAGIAVDATHVYVTNAIHGNGGAVFEVPRAGGAPLTLAGGLDGPGAIVIDDASVYWSDAEGAIRKVPKHAPNGPVSVLVPPDPAGMPSPQTALVLKDGSLYWGVDDTKVGEQAHGRVLAVATAGGPIRTVASIAFGPYGVAVDATDLYFTNFTLGGGAILRVALQDGAATIVAAGLDEPNPIAAGGDTLYFGGSGVVYALAKAGGAPNILANTGDNITGIAVDDATVFLVSGGGVYHVPRSGGPVELLATLKDPGQYAAALSLDPTCVYWTTDAPGGAGLVWKTAKDAVAK